MLRDGVENAAFATIWDPMAVRVCHAAGEGARINLRFGGKSCAGIGDPIDAEVVVQTVQDNATQTFVDAVVSLGPSAVIQVGGIEVILNSYRTQPFEPTIFTNLGIPATERDILVVKSTNHFLQRLRRDQRRHPLCRVPGRLSERLQEDRLPQGAPAAAPARRHHLGGRRAPPDVRLSERLLVERPLRPLDPAKGERAQIARQRARRNRRTAPPSRSARTTHRNGWSTSRPRSFWRPGRCRDCRRGRCRSAWRRRVVSTMSRPPIRTAAQSPMSTTDWPKVWVASLTTRRISTSASIGWPEAGPVLPAKRKGEPGALAGGDAELHRDRVPDRPDRRVARRRDRSGREGSPWHRQAPRRPDCRTDRRSPPGRPRSRARGRCLRRRRGRAARSGRAWRTAARPAPWPSARRARRGRR